MAVTYFPFDSLSAENRDRAANSQIFADYLKSFFSDGIFPVLDQFPNMHQLAVHASNPAGMSVVVDTGMGLISGRQYAQDAERTLQIPAADISLPRKDRIVLRMDLNTQYRNNELYVVAGTAASSPQPPALTRNNVVYELALATISVAANATSITAADITDERANTDVCGYVTNVLGQVDTSVINAQFQAFFEQTQEDTADWEDAQQAAFTSWFNTIKGQLGEDAAGNLQNQIGTLSGLTTSEKSNLVGAINEVNAKEPDVLDTMEEIDANTDAGKVAGALAVKELSSDLGGCQITTEGSGEDTKFFIQLGADAGSKKELGNPMLVKIGAFTPPYFEANAYYDVDLGTSDYDTIVIIAIWSDQSDAVKAGIAISSSINNRSAYQSAYGSGVTTTNECLHGENPYFQLIDGGATLRLLRGNIAWSNFPSYYLLLKLYPVINDMG